MNSAGLLTVHLCGLEHHRRTTNLDRRYILISGEKLVLPVYSMETSSCFVG